MGDSVLPEPAQLGTSAFLGVGSSLLHNFLSKDLMNYQNSLYRANLADQRAYDDPSSVMSRYRKAGLNPDLLLGQGANFGSGSSPMGALGSTGSPDFDGHLAAVSAASLNRAQEENIEADTKLKEKEAEDFDSQIEFREFTSKLQTLMHNLNVEMTKAQIDHLAEKNKEINAHIDEMVANKGVAEAEKELKRQLKEWNDKTEAARIEEIQEHVNLMKAQGRLSDEQAKLAHEQAGEISKLLDLRYDMLEAQIKNMYSQNKALEFQHSLNWYSNPDVGRLFDKKFFKGERGTFLEVEAAIAEQKIKSLSRSKR